ncbi:MAG TPA: helix-turn-helix domain-containing protein [Candidatus Moranbacteria bacterium]|nr:helix-turn-helix domain-containing protein [Candidatus Moranbacteria bacterium]
MKQNKYRRISFIEREEISRCLASGLSIRRIAGKTQRNPGALSREVKKGGGREKEGVFKKVLPPVVSVMFSRGKNRGHKSNGRENN